MITYKEAVNNLTKAGKDLAEVLRGGGGVAVHYSLTDTEVGFMYDINPNRGVSPIPEGITTTSEGNTTKTSELECQYGGVSSLPETEFVAKKSVAQPEAESKSEVVETEKPKKRSRRTKKQIADDKLKAGSEKAEGPETEEVLEEALGDIDLTSNEASEDEDPLNDLSELEDGFSEEAVEEEEEPLNVSSDTETDLSDDLDGLLD